MIQDVSPRSWPYNSMINIQKAIENCNIAIENCHLVIVDLPIKNGDFSILFCMERLPGDLDFERTWLSDRQVVKKPVNCWV